MGLLDSIYPVVRGFVVFILMIVVFLMALRLIFNYADPNPFSRVGRFAYRLKKYTDRMVYPVARFLTQMGIDNRIAPLISILVGCVAAYFLLLLVSNILMMIDGVVNGVATASIVLIVGSILYGFLGIYSLMIVLRIIMSWISDGNSSFARFLNRVTDPILKPFRRIIPNIGMFDISPIVVLILISFIQTAVAAVFLR